MSQNPATEAMPAPASAAPTSAPRARRAKATAPAKTAAASKARATKTGKATKASAPAKAAKPAKSAKAPALAVKAAKTVRPAKATQKQAAAKSTAQANAAAAKPAKVKKDKLVRDSFTMPKSEYQLLDVLKQRGTQLARPVKKSELLRAGVKLLASLADTALLAALQAVPALKTGRPSKAGGAAKTGT